jgi:pilus assembly protein CpaE
MFEYVIVDAGRSFDSRPLEALNLADLVLLVGVPSVPAARNLRLAAELLTELGLPAERLRLLLNRYHKRDGVSARDLEETVKLAVRWRIPADDKLMADAANTGVPAVASAARSDLARAFAQLAADLAELQLDPRTATSPSTTAV